MKLIPLAFLFLMIPLNIHAKEPYRAKLLTPLSKEGGEEILKISTLFEKKPIYLLGKGKITPSSLGNVATIAITHIQDPSSIEPCVLKEAQLTPLILRKDALGIGSHFTLSLDSSLLKEALQQNPSKKSKKLTPSSLALDVQTERRVEENMPPDKNQKKKDLKSSQRKDAVSPQNQTASSYLQKNSASLETKGNASDPSPSKNTKGSSFESGRREGWASLHTPEREPREPKQKQEKTSSPLPEIRVEVTDKGCEPLVDETHHRIYIARKTLTFENNKLKSTSKCEKGLEFYPLERDYKCENCKPLIKLDESLVYPKYQLYWINAENNRINLDKTPQLDRDNPYPFVEDEKGCPFEFDFERNKAYPQTRTLYYDRWQNAHEIKTCTRTNHEGYPLYETEEGCTPSHEFNNKRSKIRTRVIFSVDSLTHEAKKCTESGDWIPHAFVKVQCKPILDKEGGLITPTAKRQLRGVYITDECEPLESQKLERTRKGCEGQYVHDWENGLSYPKERYFYEDFQKNPIFVTKCLKTEKALKHKFKVVGYNHQDSLKVSYPLKEITFEGLEGLVKLSSPIQEEPIPYIYLKEEERMSREKPVEDSSFKTFLTEMVKVWQRADNSLFKEVLGQGIPLKQEKSYQIRKETRTIPLKTVWARYRRGNDEPDNNWTHDSTQTHTSGWCFGKTGETRDGGGGGTYYKNIFTTYYALQQREIKIYEENQEEAGEWVTTGESSRN